MEEVALVAGAGLLWIGHALGLTWLMRCRGFNPLSWFAVSLILGPALWPLAAVELFSGPSRAVLVRSGRLGDGDVDVFVALGRDELPPHTAQQLRRLAPRSRRLVLARVIRAGGPTWVPADAERFLCDTASRLGIREAELRLCYGDLDRVVGEIQEQGDFGLVLRGDQTSEPFDGDGSRQEMRWQRDVPAA